MRPTKLLLALPGLLLALVAPAGAHAYTIEMSSPAPGQTFATAQPIFTGTTTTANGEAAPSTLYLNVVGGTASGGYQDTKTVSVQPDGSWTGGPFTLADGQYQITVCDYDVRNPAGVTSPTCSSSINFGISTASGGSSGGGGSGGSGAGSAPTLAASISVPASASFKQFLSGKLRMTLTCNQRCAGVGVLILPPETARQIGFANWRKGFKLADLEANGPVIGYAPVVDITPLFESDRWGFKLPGRLAVEAQLRVDGDNGSTTVLKKTTLEWKAANDHHGQGTHEIVRISPAQRKYSLSARDAFFRVQLRGIPHLEHVVQAWVETAGRSYYVSRFGILKSGRLATVQELARGGTFTLDVVLGGKKSRAKALGPVAAQVHLQVFDKQHPDRSSDSFLNFVMTP